MANEKHLKVIKEAIEENVVAIWNRWREENPDVYPDLSGANLSGADLYYVDLSNTNLSSADLHGAVLAGANFWEADAQNANLSWANLKYANAGHANFDHANLASADLSFIILNQANLTSADLHKAHLNNASLYKANLKSANLSNVRLNGAWLDEADLRATTLDGASFDSASLRNANLSGMDLSGIDLSADLIETNLANANLSGAKLTGMLLRTDLRNANMAGCHVYGVSAWDVQLAGAYQKDLVITPDGVPQITVDDLEVAQFVYLLLFNPKIRTVIDTITSKVVLILGRFTEERKTVLDAMREALRHYDLVPIIFDFEPPKSRDLTETISTLAHLARFIIADITDPRSIPQELTAIIPELPSVPVQSLILASQQEYAMYPHWKRYPWVLPIFRYDDSGHLLASLADKVIGPAETKRLEMTKSLNSQT